MLHGAVMHFQVETKKNLYCSRVSNSSQKSTGSKVWFFFLLWMMKVGGMGMVGVEEGLTRDLADPGPWASDLSSLIFMKNCLRSNSKPNPKPHHESE